MQLCGRAVFECAGFGGSLCAVRHRAARADRRCSLAWGASGGAAGAVRACDAKPARLAPSSPPPFSPYCPSHLLPSLTPQSSLPTLHSPLPTLPAPLLRSSPAHLVQAQPGRLHVGTAVHDEHDVPLELVRGGGAGGHSGGHRPPRGCCARWRGSAAGADTGGGRLQDTGESPAAGAMPGCACGAWAGACRRARGRAGGCAGVSGPGVRAAGRMRAASARQADSPTGTRAQCGAVQSRHAAKPARALRPDPPCPALPHPAPPAAPFQPAGAALAATLCKATLTNPRAGSWLQHVQESL